MKWLRVATYVIALALSAVPASAQEAVVREERRAAAHRFFDKPNIGLIVLESGALLADGITTQHLLKADPEHLFSREADPIARPFVYAGWPGQIAGGTLFVSAEVGLRYLLHKKEHHRLERWLPLVLTVYGTAGALHNARYWNRADALREAARR